jgi:hypothetical protein
MFNVTNSKQRLEFLNKEFHAHLKALFESENLRKTYDWKWFVMLFTHFEIENTFGQSRFVADPDKMTSLDNFQEWVAEYCFENGISVCWSPDEKQIEFAFNTKPSPAPEKAHATHRSGKKKKATTGTQTTIF